MSAGTFTFDLFVTLLLSGGLLYCYGDWMRHRLVVTLSVLIAWYFSFLIIFVLPLDVSSTAYKQCLNVTAASSASGMTPGHNRTEGFSFHSATNQSIVTEDDIIHTRNSKAGSLTRPTKTSFHFPFRFHVPTVFLFFSSPSDSALPPPSTLAPTQPPTTSSSLPPGSSTPTPLVPICDPPYSLLPEDVLTNLWRVVYWSSQLLTWLILPLMQSYTQAGEFTVWGKLRSSLLDNAIYYTSYLFIALILVIYIALQPDLQVSFFFFFFWRRRSKIK